MFKNLQNIVNFAQLQFKSKNICFCSIKLPDLVKISATVIEILTFEGTLHSKLTLGFFLAGLKVYIIVTYLSQIARL